MNYHMPSKALIALSIIIGLIVFMTVLNYWLAFAFRYPFDSVTPWLWFAPPDIWRMVNPEAFQTALNYAAITGGAVLAGCLYLAVQSPNPKPHGDARWARRGEIVRAGLMDPSGVILGKLGRPKGFAPFIRSTRDKYCNTLLVAPPGGGKGVGVVIPTLLTWPGSAVVLDVKGENAEITAKCRAEMGDTIYVFSPYDEEGRTHRFNPFTPIKAISDPKRQYTELRRVATRLLVSSGSADSPFIENARDLFTATASVVLAMDNPTIGDVRKLLAPVANADGSSEGGMAARFRNLAEQATHEPAKTALAQFAAFDPKSIATHLSVLKAAGLNAWSDPAVEAATSGNDFDLTSLRSNPQSIYIVIAPNDMEALAPVARLLFQSVIAAMQANTPKPEDKLPVLLLLDEFKTLGRMDSVVNATGTLRGYGGHMLLVVQGLPNLEEVYGHAGASSLMNACQVHAYMSINDPQSKQMISRSLGTYGVEMTQESTSRSFGSFGGSRTASKQLRAMKMIEEDAVNRMGEDSILLIPKDMRPIFARKVIYHQDRALKKLACKSDPRPAPSGQAVATSEGNKMTLDPETQALATQAFRLLTRLNIAQNVSIATA